MVTIATGSKKMGFVSMKSRVMWGLITIVVMFSSQCIASTVCTGDPCKNGGTCSVVGDSFECACAPGWDGDTCEDVSCKNNPCLNEGTCAVDSSNIVCTCAPGWDGDTCEDVSCKNNPCLNEGTCAVDSSNIVCTCAPSWDGDTCED
ncbi:protein jagged-1b-like, partial [Haliotis rubra]|uniref:protein jagged-1b-like n=1 Tax=Haliotis rubra TaxID=36100 RepID=UPI001EE547FE